MFRNSDFCYFFLQDDNILKLRNVSGCKQDQIDCKKRNDFRSVSDDCDEEVKYCRRSSRMKDGQEQFSLEQGPSRLTNERSLICEYCEKSFNKRSTLKRHVNRIHSSDRPYICEFCKKAFRLIKLLKSHILNRHILKSHTHSTEKPFSCEYCEKPFDNLSNLQNHLCIHSSKRQYICKYCKKDSYDSRNFKWDVSVHMYGKIFICVYCKKGQFNQEASMYSFK